jgi:heme exporter protein D
MIWQGWNDFFVMGGYGGYVWGSVAAALVLVVGEVGALAARRRAALRALAGQA